MSANIMQQGLSFSAYLWGDTVVRKINGISSPILSNS